VSPNFFNLAKSSNEVQILTISFSHYCELACWALKLAKIPYREHAYAPGQHVLPVLSVRVGDRKKKYLSESSRVSSVKEQERLECGLLETEEEKAKRLKVDRSKRSTAVPIAILPSGEVLVDSWDCASIARLGEVDPTLKKILDEELGPLARQVMYFHIFQPQNHQYFHELCLMNHGWFWRMCWHLFVGSYLIKLMTKLFVPKGFSIISTHEKLSSTLRKLDKIVSQRKGIFLGGDQIGLADIALASLASPLLTPPLYCEGKYTHIFNKILESDSSVRKEVEGYRNTTMGQYVLELYSQHRL